ncbi:MAG: SDR family NAD-dependent epimerase/dehydratase, partial [Alphaproteobacteria bacterium]|nr:SDR family NAD-dependent epimerase/dehydratase [Alphaproteobacteria bacterium]
VDGKIWNAGYDNLKVREIADMVRGKVGDNVEIVVTPTNDHRSYHVSSQKIRRELGFTPRHTVEDAIVDLKRAFDGGKVPHAMTDDRYYNIKRMQAYRMR